MDERKARKAKRKQEQKALKQQCAQQLGLPSKSSRRAATKRHREETFKALESSGLITGGSHKIPRASPKEAEDLLSLEAQMKAFEQAKMAKGTRPHWADTDSDKDEPTHLARFKPEDEQAERPRVQKLPKGKSPINRDTVVSPTRFISEKPKPPLDSAGHDKVVYMGSTSETPERMLVAMDEMKESIHQQEALLVEAKKEADHKAQIIAALGAEYAAHIFAFKDAKAEGQIGSQSSVG